MYIPRTSQGIPSLGNPNQGNPSVDNGALERIKLESRVCATLRVSSLIRLTTKYVTDIKFITPERAVRMNASWRPTYNGQ